MLLTAIAVSFSQQITPAITPIEALAVADWFCRCVGAKVATDRFSVRLNGWAGPTDNYGCYLVTFGGKGTEKMSVQVDAISGDVTHASVWPHPMRMVSADPRRSNEWLKKLGRGQDLVYDKYNKRYVTALKGTPVINLNGWTRSEFRVQDGVFAYYNGIGAVPPMPTGKPTISEKKALDIAYASEENRTTTAFDPQYMKAEKGLFYDEKSSSTRWVWRILWLRAKGNGDSVHHTAHIDAQTGRLLPDNDYQTSRFMYRARSPRVGLKKVGSLKFNSPLIAKADSILKILGQDSTRFSEIECNTGLRMSGSKGYEFEMGPSGDLRIFRTSYNLSGERTSKGSIERARSIVSQLYPRLPEGTFTLNRQRGMGGGYGSVYYIQRAFGYDYLTREVVTIQFDPNGKVISYQASPPAARPSGVPTKLLTKGDIEAIAIKMAVPHVQKSTPKIRYFAQAQALQLGWHPDGAGSMRLCYWVSVSFMRDVKNWAIQGGGSYYPFDAVTGKCYRKFP